MILVIGGAFSGKKEYVKQRFHIQEEEMTDGAVCPLDAVYSAGCITHFHQWVRRMLQEGAKPFSLADQLIRENPEAVVITNELGYGIVPMDAFDREYREATGRICTRLAQEAREVHRVICGIGTVIKHD